MKTWVDNFWVWVLLAAVFPFHAQAATLYVDINGTNATSPYASWSTAATDIQSAVDSAHAGDLILVTNGVYASGGRAVYGLLTNRVSLNKAVTLQSVNGPANTLIVGNPVLGNSAARCVYLTNNAVLVGFTLTNGATGNNQFQNDPHQLNGGGLWCEPGGGTIISNCVLTANSSFGYGGGAYQGTFLHCTFKSNNGGSDGGGAYGGYLSDCIICSNTVGGGVYTGPGGGGVAQSVLTNCTLFANIAVSGGGAASSTLSDCFILTNSALGFLSNGRGGGVYGCILNHCTVSGNSASAFGGGASDSSLNNCLLSGNLTPSKAAGYAIGGGAYASFMTNCVLTGNSSTNVGGGTYYGTLINCTLVNNRAAVSGGGASYATSINCIIYFNSAPLGSNYDNGTLQFSCAAPLPSGVGNLSTDPMLVDLAGANFHLQSNSPCINSGNNSCITGANDLDLAPRLAGGTVDIGAYEFQSPASIVSYAWLQQYGLPTDGSADFADTDGTGMNNWQKWIAGLNPTNPASVLALKPPTVTNNATGLTIRWQSVNNRTYYLQRATNLIASRFFSTIQSNLVGQAGTTIYQDTAATNKGPYFYRIGVQ